MRFLRFFAVRLATIVAAVTSRDVQKAAAPWQSPNPEDEAARVLRARAEQFAEAPPPADWRRVYTATSK